MTTAAASNEPALPIIRQHLRVPPIADQGMLKTLRRSLHPGGITRVFWVTPYNRRLTGELLHVRKPCRPALQIDKNQEAHARLCADRIARQRQGMRCQRSSCEKIRAKLAVATRTRGLAEAAQGCCTRLHVAGTIRPSTLDRLPFLSLRARSGKILTRPRSPSGICHAQPRPKNIAVRRLDLIRPAPTP